MALTLQPAEVVDWTGVTVSAAHISVAADLIDTQTGYTVDEHNTDRLVNADRCRMAWALVAAKVKAKLDGEGSGSVISETQGDYSYTDDPTLARARFGNVCDGTPGELLDLNRAEWAHI